MGKQTKLKNMQFEQKEAAFMSAFSRYSKEAKDKANLPAEPLVSEFAGYENFFVRDPESFVLKAKSSDRRKHILLMSRHLFIKYPVPKILENVWINPDKKERLRYFPNIRANEKMNFKKWFICVTQGGSLYKEYAKDYMTKKELSYFLTCKHELTINQGLYYAVAKANGANDGEALRICKSRINEKPFIDFWKDCVKFFTNSPDNMPGSISQIDDLLDFLEYKKNENANYSILGFGYTYKSLHKKMIDWHYELRRMKSMGTASWNGFDFPDLTFIEKTEHGTELTWHFEQIKNTKALVAEGTAMHHCVAGYRNSCANGSCSIWSVYTLDKLGTKKRRLTIEMRQGGYIAQIRGFANRTAKPQESNMVNKWRRALGLRN